MEPDASRSPAHSDEPARTEWRALARLRERVETAAREIERLRKENAELTARLSQAGGPALPLDGEPEAVRAQIQGFIEAIDRVLETPEASGDGASTEAAA